MRSIRMADGVRPTLTLTLAFLLASSVATAGGPSRVRVEKTATGFTLTRDGKPYIIKGGGGDGPMKALADAGGNSIRTWGAEKAGAILDEAQKNGLTVTLGIWLGHRRHGFDYDNADQVAKQLDEARKIVLKYKDHPALLMWGLGNEMEGYDKGADGAIWSAVECVAAEVKRLDPNHPTMTVVAEIGGDRVKNLHRLCPSIDVIGINSYGGAASIPKRYKAIGGQKPFVLTEFGPPGIWETAKTPWGAPIEMTSTAKGESYRKTYEQAIAPGGLCVGSYAFTWGFKQEATATWFGLFLPDGSKLAGVDVLTEMWTGKPPADRCPEIASLTITGSPELEPGATVKAALKASDPEGAALKVDWLLVGETARYATGGDAEAAPPSFRESVVRSTTTSAELAMPKGGGGYRLYAYVRDGKGGAAVANVPLFVKGPVEVPKAKVATLPLVVYGEASDPNPAYAPSGYMGNAKAITMDPASADRPHSGKTCLRVQYSAKSEWGGVVWQSPADDWGDRPGGLNLSGAKTLSFWARGEEGGEVVTFEFGILGRDKAFFDTATAKLDKVTLKPEWTRYAIDLKGRDLTRIKTGFAWVLAADGKPVTFYLDDVRFE
jgi:Glycosyl hydrolases family 2, TIM barrel domain